MKHKIVSLLGMGLVVSAILTLGWTDTWEDIQAAAGSIRSVKTDFVQTKHLPILTHPLVSHGKLWYQAPGSLRWEYVSPVQSVLLMHNGQVKRFIRDTRSREFREESGQGLDAMQVVMGEITQWLAGRFDDNPFFAARLEPGGKIMLSPKQKTFRNVIQRIELHLDQKQKGMIRRVLIFEGETAYTELAFDNTVLNLSIDDSVFQKVL